jgi:hypothetical protein
MAFPPKRRFTIGEAAEELNVSKSQITEWLAEGILSASAYHPEFDRWLIVEPAAIRRAAGRKSKIRAEFITKNGDGKLSTRETFLSENPKYLRFEQLHISSKALKSFDELHAFRPSKDYSSIIWRGQGFEFTKTQANVIKFLHEQNLGGNPRAISQEEILDAIKFHGDEQRIDKIFRNRKSLHPAFKTLLVKVGRAKYRLDI